MGKSAERCPYCGSHVPVVKTDTVPALPDENYKGNEICAMRYQRLMALPMAKPRFLAEPGL